MQSTGGGGRTQATDPHTAAKKINASSTAKVNPVSNDVKQIMMKSSVLDAYLSEDILGHDAVAACRAVTNTEQRQSSRNKKTQPSQHLEGAGQSDEREKVDSRISERDDN